MSLKVELFRSDDYVRYGEVALLPLLHTFFEPLIGESLDDARFLLTFLPVDDPRVLPGPPSLVNLRSSHGYVQVHVSRDGELIYRHPHPLREIIGPQLQKILIEREPAETHWGFGISGQNMDQIALIRPAPQMTYGVDVRSRARGAPLFHLEEVAEPEPPVSTLAERGADITGSDTGSSSHSPISVVLSQEIWHAFLVTTPYSAEVEEGGFLTGHVFRDRDEPSCFIVEITDVIPAVRTGASMINFTFTGESFLRIGEKISASDTREQLLGWYHTHLFSATDALGLSSVDIDLHRSTFRRPWQVAALINITGTSRVLRFYCTDGDTMIRAPYWTVER